MIPLRAVLRERNVIKKDWRKVRLRIALCYPNVYAAGMTSFAVHLLYALFNAREEVACERVFYVPGETPRSLESGQPLHRFDVVAFSLQFETDYARAIEMLLRAGIPPLVEHRNRPWVIAGGPCAAENPLPMSPFIDVFLIGELEPVSDQLIDALIHATNQTDLDSRLDTHFFLAGRKRAQRVLVLDLNQASHPRCQVLPVPPYPKTLEPVFGQSLLVEISRGCDRHCNFCLISYQSSPCRERSLNTLESIIDGGVRCTGVEKVALITSAFADYSQLGPLLEAIVARNLQLSVPSFRADISDLTVLDSILQGGQRTLTFAPEAGSERLRGILAKSISNETFHHTITTAIAKGFNQFKLYFLVGLPTETDDDIRTIQEFCIELQQLPPRRHRLHVNAFPLIPKPHTPFQWYGLTPLPLLKQRLQKLRKLNRISRVRLDLTNPRWAVVQAALSRGTAELAPLILAVAQDGRQTVGTWFHAARTLGVNLETYATTPYSSEEQLPWDIIDVGVKPNILLRRFKKLE